MDMTSNPSPTLRSPRSGGGGAASYESSELVSTGAVAGIGSPKNRGRGSVSPAAVTQVIRIGDLESIVSSTGIVVAPATPMEVGTSNLTHDRFPRGTVVASSMADDGNSEAQKESSELGSTGSGGGNSVKKPAWNKLSNVANAEAVASVMGADSWPALSEATRASPKSLSSESFKASSDGSLSAAQGSGTALLSSPKPEKNSNPISSSTPNHVQFNRQRSMKRGGGNLSNSVVVGNGGSSQPPSRSFGTDAAPNNSGRQGNYANDSSLKDNVHHDSGQRGGFGSHSDGGNGHQPQRNNSFRRGNGGGGQHSRGDGYHHNGFGGRRGSSDQERGGGGSHDWNSNRSFPVRDTHIQPQRGGPLRPTIRGPPTPPFILPQPVAVHPYGGMPVMFPDMQPVMYYPGPHPDPFRPVSLGPPMAPMLYAFPDIDLHNEILKQIEYYFSNENLPKDMFLRQRMDEQGWVHINLIAGFKKVTQLTDNIPLILDILRNSSLIEVEGERVRRRNDWAHWLVPQSSAQYISGGGGGGGGSSTQSPEQMLSANLKNITLANKAPPPPPPPRHGSGLAETYRMSPSSSGEWSSGGDKTSHAQGGGRVESSPLDSR